MDLNKRINIALVCTSGGHFEQMTNLSEFYNLYDHFWITNRNKQTESQRPKERMYYIKMAHFKKPWTYLGQIRPVWKIFAREKPTHILSTGSGRTALIPFVLSKLLSLRFIHVDTFSRVYGHSKFGNFLLRTKNKIYTQWEDSRNQDAIYIGPIFRHQENQNRYPAFQYIFVTVGTREEPFTRLLKAVEDLAKEGKIKEKIVVQGGHTKYPSDYFEIFDFSSPEKINDYILNARYVITQESAGIGTQCLKSGTRFIVMPRDFQYGELPTKSDMKEDLHWRLQELGYTKVVTAKHELEKAIEEIESVKVGFNFNNNLAISTLRKLMEEI